MDTFNKKYDSIKKKLIVEYADTQAQCNRLREECYSLGFLYQTIENGMHDGYTFGKYWKKYGIVSCRIYCEYKFIDERMERFFWIALGNKLNDLEYSTPVYKSGPNDLRGFTAALDNILAGRDINTNKDLKKFRDEVVRMTEEKGLNNDIDSEIAAAFVDLKFIHV